MALLTGICALFIAGLVIPAARSEDPFCQGIIVKSEDSKKVTGTVEKLRVVDSMKVRYLINRSQCPDGSFGIEKDTNVVWASNNCQAKFTVCQNPAPIQPGSWCGDIVLKSDGGRVEGIPPMISKIDRLLVKYPIDKATCQYKKSYGFDGLTVWADKGCKAKFKACQHPVPPAGYICQNMILKSENGERVEKKFDKLWIIEWIAYRFTIGRTTLCVKDVNFGYNGNTVWASDNCMANIIACRNEPPPQPNSRCQDVRLESKGDRVEQVMPWDVDYLGIKFKVGTWTICHTRPTGKSYGLDGKRTVWATNKCVGKFRVCRNPELPKQTDTTKCYDYKVESKDGQRDEVVVDKLAKVDFMMMKYPIGTWTVCIHNQGYGLTAPNTLWAEQNCVAKLTVCGEKGGAPDPNPPPPTTDKCDEATDIALVVDGSESVRSVNFAKAKSFAAEYAGRFTIGADKARFASLVFGEDVVAGTNFTSGDDANKVVEGISGLPYEGAGTDLFEGLQYAIKPVFDHARDGVTRTVVLITDSEAQSGDATSPSDFLQSRRGAQVAVVGVGPYVSDTYLKRLASSDDLYFKAESYSSLQDILDDLVAATCPPPPDCE